MSQILLSEEQKQRLESLAQYAPEALIRRARLILAYGEGKLTMAASLDAGISRGRARFWKRQYLIKGMEIFNFKGLDDQPVEGPAVSTDTPGDVSTSGIAQIDTSESQVDIQVDFPFPKPLDSIGVTSADSLAEAGRKVWLYHFAIMLSHEEGTLLGENIEELHDMRVATRRMRTAFDVFGPGFEPKIMKHYLKGLRAIGRILGQVRDMDVLLVHANNYQATLDPLARPGLVPLLDAWRQTIENARAKLKLHLQSDSYYNFKHEFNYFLQSPELEGWSIAHKTGIASGVREIVPILVYSRFAAVRAYETIIPTASISQLHALRIEFKKFRYTLEYFREILGKHVEEAIDELKQLQDHLGELHDADVACQLVRGFLKAWEEEQKDKIIPERMSPEPIVTYLAFLHAERYRLMVEFPTAWVKFNRPGFRQNLARAISVL